MLPQEVPAPQGTTAPPATPPPPTASIQNVQISTLDDSSSILAVTVANLPDQPLIKDYILNIANHVFGLSDAPITRIPTAASKTVLFTAVVPTTLVASARQVSVQPLFWNTKEQNGRNYKLTAEITDLPVESSVEKVVLVGKDVVREAGKDVTYATFMITGNRLEHAYIVMPSGVRLCCAGSMTDENTIRFFRLKQDDWKAYKAILLEKTDGERPELVTLPASDDKTTTPAPILTPKYRITVGMDDAAVTGDNLDKLKVKAVTYNKKPLNPPTLSTDKKSLILTGLYAAGVTTEPVTRDIEFEFEGGQKTTVTLEVVNSKVESTPK